MNLTVVINELLPDREFTSMNADGQSVTNRVIGMEIEGAGASFFAEMFGNVAKKFKAEKNVGKGTVMSVNLDFEARSFQRQDGQVGHGTNVKILGYTIINRISNVF